MYFILNVFQSSDCFNHKYEKYHEFFFLNSIVDRVEISEVLIHDRPLMKLVHQITHIFFTYFLLLIKFYIDPTY